MAFRDAHLERKCHTNILFCKNYIKRFVDSKNNHAYRYAMYRGIEKINRTDC